MGFTSHRYQASKRKGVDTFIDNEKLVKGQKAEELFGYTEKSKVSVPIFSKGYDDLTWCSKEITDIVECKRLIVPVFFDVQPTDVGNQTSHFAPAFKRYHENKSMEVEMSKWSDALSKAGTRTDEAKLINLILKRILIEVNMTPLFVAEHPVALDSRIADVKKVLEIEAQDHARIVGIYAMGGMGKTTLAKATYNQISSLFDACSFISNIREVAAQSCGLVSLQKQLLRDVFKDDNVNISSTDQGIGMIKQRIWSKKVLLVLDDVDCESQVKVLVGGLDWFRPGSRIIITTRDEQVLRAARVNQNNVYKLEKLDATQSLQLFSLHAFEKEEPDAKFAELSREVASAAAGLPLALKILGSHFRDLEDKEWGIMLRKLNECQDKEIHERLKISFDALDVEEKQVFFGYSMRGKQLATLMWESCRFFPEITIKVLIRKSLVSIIDGWEEFDMHDLVRDMGRKIVEDESRSNPGTCSRLWKKEETLHVLQHKMGTRNIEALTVLGDEFSQNDAISEIMWDFVSKDERPISESIDSDSMDVEAFAGMAELRMLRLGYTTLEGEYEHFPRMVKWLEWSPRNLDFLPSTLHLDNIVILDLSGSSISQLWNPQRSASTKVFDKLKVLKLCGCVELTICPDFTSMLCLQILNLARCEKITELHRSIGHLKILTFLTLAGCKSLMEIPPEIWQLVSLKYLDLRWCSQITAMPPELGDSKSLKRSLLVLESLRLDGCENFTICPDFTSTPHLQYLSFMDCRKMSELDPSIGLLKSLTLLSMYGCESLKQLPKEVWQLTSLEKLALDRSGVTTLASELGDFKSLKALTLSRTSITTLPESIRHLKQLRVLRCPPTFKEIPDCICSLPNLEVLDAEYCVSLLSLPNLLGNLRSLKKLVLSCTDIEELPDSITSLEKLEVLELSNCKRLKYLPSSARFGSMLLKNHGGEESSERQHYSLPQFPPSFTELSASGCSELEMIADVSNAKGLQTLDLRGCRKLVDVPGIGQLKWLDGLELGGCRSLSDSLWKRVQEANLQHLTRFSISGSFSTGESSDAQYICFFLPKWVKSGCLMVLKLKESGLGSSDVEEDESGLDRNHVEEDESGLDSSTFVHIHLINDGSQSPFQISIEAKVWRRHDFFHETQVQYVELGEFVDMMRMRVSISSRPLLDGYLRNTDDYVMNERPVVLLHLNFGSP
ncbi:putative WRKY transcription factor 16 [Nymphaea thermarum]|nr:putative WRKY transcription factor 16 [Nymphaea thermarum]